MLVHVENGMVFNSWDSMSLAMSPELKKTVAKAKQFHREQGSNILCLTKGVLKWNYQNQACLTPIVICPIEHKINKIKQELELTYDEDVQFINPFLIKAFQSNFELLISNEDIEVGFEALEKKWKALGLDISIEEQSFIGNFHHHRFDVLRDLEEISGFENLGDNLTELLNESENHHLEHLPLSGRFLYPSDNDQSNVFKEVAERNVVVHGPPGTGKSQVLTNMIGKIIYGGLSGVVVSEKRAALEVLQKKLSKYGLQDFLFFPTQLNESKTVLEQLKRNWDYLEDFEPLRSLQLDLSSQLIDALQFKLNVLTREDLIGGVSYDVFQSMLDNRDLKNVAFEGASTSIIEYSNKQPQIKEVFDLGLNKLIEVLPQHLVGDSNVMTLDQKVKFLKNQMKSLQQVFDFKTKSGVAELMKLSSFSQMMANEQHKPYFKILNPTGNELNRFNRFYKKLIKVKKELEIYRDQEKNWKVQPTLEEAEGLLQRLDIDAFFAKYRLKRRMNSLLTSPFIPHQEALEKWVVFLKLNAQKLSLEASLMTMGVSEESEMVWITNLQTRLNEEGFKSWKRTSPTQNNLLASWGAELHIFIKT